MERTLRRCAVSEEPHRDVTVGPKLRCRRRSDGNRQARGHDAVGAEDPEFRVGDVHRAAAAAIRALVLAHELGEHPGRVESFGQTVAVAAVGGGDDVRRPQWPACADRRSLLPDRKVDEAGDLAIAIEIGNPLFEPADQAASGGASRRNRASRTRAVEDGPRDTTGILYWSVQRRKSDDRSDRDPPDRSPTPVRSRGSAW